MAVYLPKPTDTVPIKPPPEARVAFDDLELLVGQVFSWNAFLVTTRSEREELYKHVGLVPAAIECLEGALTHDFRKILVRRCVWEHEIAHVAERIMRASAVPNRHHDPYAPLPDDSILAAVSRQPDKGPTKMGDGSFDSDADPDLAPSTPGRHSPEVSDDDLTAARDKKLDQKDPSIMQDFLEDKEGSQGVSNPLLPSKNVGQHHSKSQGGSSAPPPVQDLSTAVMISQVVPRPASSFPYCAFEKFVGIENQANTCYLNSALESLYHIPYFRSCMYNVNVATLRRKDVVEALQSLFAALQLKYPGVTTVPLTNAFRWTSEELRHQHDVHEMILILFDCIEKQIFSPQSRTASPGNDPQHVSTDEEDDGERSVAHNAREDADVTGPEGASPRPPMKNFIQKLFRGEQMYYTSVAAAEYESQQSEPFLVVELPVQNLCSLEASLEEISRPTTIDGFMVESSDGTKSSHTAERSLRFSQLPPVLLIHPNRVVFDFEKLAQVTVNNKWTFPIHLDLAPFTRNVRRSQSPPQDTLSAAEGLTPPRAREDVADAISAEDQSPEPVRVDSAPPMAEVDHQQQMAREGSLFQQSEVFALSDYELRSVVLHSGSAASGHYVACVHHGSGNWVCFNDDNVHTIHESEVLRRAFGGSTHSLYDRVERAKLLVYVRKSSAARLLAEVPVPDHLRAIAQEHEGKHQVEFRLINEAFADGLGGRKPDLLASCQHRVEFRASASMQDIYAIVAKKLLVSADRIIIWKYGYGFVEQEMDKAIRVKNASELMPPARHFAVEILPQTNQDQEESRPKRDSISSMFPLRSWRSDGSLHYVGNARSIEDGISMAIAAFHAGAAPDAPTAAVVSAAAGASATSPVRQEESTGDSNSNDDSSGPGEDKWVMYSYYGSHPTLRNVTNTQTLINGVCLIAAPATVSPVELRELLSARPVSITFYLINPTDCDDATELWDLVVDENMTYTDLQQVVFKKLRSDENGGIASGCLPPGEQHIIGPDCLISPTLVGFYPHHIDTCGPSRVLHDAFRKGFGTEAKVRDILRAGHGSGGGGHNTSTDSASTMVRRVYINVLPGEMVDIKDWHSMQYFVFATGLERKVIGYAHLFKNCTVGDFIGALHRQVSRRLVELQPMPTSRIRILGLDWKGKIYRVFRNHSDILQGVGVYTYSVDVVSLPPPSPSSAQVHDGSGGVFNETDIDEVMDAQHGSSSSSGGGVLDSPTRKGSGDDASLTDDCTASASKEGSGGATTGHMTSNSPPLVAKQPKWQNFDVYHIVQYGDVEDNISTPTNICLDISDPLRITGEVIMDAVLDGARLAPNSLRLNTLRLLGQVILRGYYIADSVRLACDQAITSDVLAQVGAEVRCILIDHTECMFASSMASGGSKTPSPGRTPIKLTKQRAPEAVIRIAD